MPTTEHYDVDIANTLRVGTHLLERPG